MTLDRCIVGDCRDGMRQMIAAGIKVQTVVTSPPYWGLRDYGTAQWIGGDTACDHMHKVGGTNSSTLGEASGGNGMSDAARVRSIERSFVPYARTCMKCGARRIDQQLGLERTPMRYLARMRSVFRLVWELLADDGTLWLNLGDSYYSPRVGGGIGKNSTINGQGTQAAFRDGQRARNSKVQQSNTASAHASAANRRHGMPGVKPKDLIGIPWRVAFALQADGWFLRSDIIWHKPNPMPESVTDRPTKAHEYIFLLTKSERYYYDAEAIQEPLLSGPSDLKKMVEQQDRIGGKHKHLVDEYSKASSETNIGRKRSVGNKQAALAALDHRYASLAKAADDSENGQIVGRNKRSVWTVATQPFRGAHFAVFPEKLIEPCILAGSRPGDVVFDPFMGAGTVAAVATRLGRHWLGCELNPQYVELQKPRAAQRGLPV